MKFFNLDSAWKRLKTCSKVVTYFSHFFFLCRQRFLPSAIRKLILFHVTSISQASYRHFIECNFCEMIALGINWWRNKKCLGKVLELRFGVSALLNDERNRTYPNHIYIKIVLPNSFGYTWFLLYLSVTSRNMLTLGMNPRL